METTKLDNTEAKLHTAEARVRDLEQEVMDMEKMLAELTAHSQKTSTQLKDARLEITILKGKLVASETAYKSDLRKALRRIEQLEAERTTILKMEEINSEIMRRNHSHAKQKRGNKDSRIARDFKADNSQLRRNHIQGVFNSLIRGKVDTSVDEEEEDI
ncbi:hypothetical protein AAMO2058_001296800 [Amorphochlora amoebiformis]